MTAVIKRALPVPPLPATKSYHQKPKMPAGLDSPALKWREHPKTPARKPKRPTRQKGKLWTEEERQDALQRHAAGETWQEIADHYGTTAAAIREAAHVRRKTVQSPQSCTRMRRWTNAEREEIIKRHEAGEMWKDIAADYDIGLEGIRSAAYYRRRRDGVSIADNPEEDVW